MRRDRKYTTNLTSKCLMAHLIEQVLERYEVESDLFALIEDLSVQEAITDVLDGVKKEVREDESCFFYKEVSDKPKLNWFHINPPRPRLTKSKATKRPRVKEKVERIHVTPEEQAALSDILSGLLSD